MSEKRQAGVLMIAHGSRRAAANQDLVTLSAGMESQFPETIFSIAYLELTEPTIPQGLDELIQRGAEEIVMFPYFLSMGVHVVEDLEQHRQEYIEKYPKLGFKIASPLGLHPLMNEIVRERIHTCMNSQD